MPSQLSLMFDSRAVVMPDGVEIELSTAQARWILPFRAARLNDPRRSAECDGCAVFGLCVSHACAVPS